MKCPPIAENENQRLQALIAHGLGDEALVPNLDPVVRIAAQMFSTPVSAINMIGSDHVFFAASIGIGETDMRRDVSFCAHAIAQHDVMVVTDTRTDERFHDNPLVTGPANVRFYAGVPLKSPDGHALGALCIIDNKPRPDFSDDDRQRLQELARMASDRLELRRIEFHAASNRPAFEEYAGGSPTPVVWFDADMQLLAWNQAAASLHGMPPALPPGLCLTDLLTECQRQALRDWVARNVSAGGIDPQDAPPEVTGRRSDGTTFPLGLAIFCWREGNALRFEAILKDQTAARLQDDALRRMTNIDVLTGLANRNRFYRRVEHSLLDCTAAAVLMIDLDGFKDVNGTLGHQEGDDILREIAARLTRLCNETGPEHTLPARIGGDEFAILLPGAEDVNAAVAFASAVMMAIAAPIGIDSHEVRIAASCGIAFAPGQAQEPLELVGNADLALFQAKHEGRGRVCVFAPTLKEEAMARRSYGMELHRAVDQGEFRLFYQPQVRLHDGALTGAEALLRWQHPQRGLLSPAAFLPAMEDGPLAATVGAWVLDEACAQAAYWRRHGAPDFRIGINLFGAQFRDSDLMAAVLDALHRHGLPPQAIELEITENIVLRHDERVLDVLQRLRELGVGIAFDDFGTGYASLSLLTSYPLSRIKIDRSFVRGMIDSRREAAVIRAILDMAYSLEIDTIAEGIETVSQRDLLQRARCDEGQGYLFARPLPPDQFEESYRLGMARQRAVA